MPPAPRTSVASSTTALSLARRTAKTIRETPAGSEADTEKTPERVIVAPLASAAPLKARPVRAGPSLSTVMATVSAAESGGAPSSVTRTVTWTTPPGVVGGIFQRNAPVAGSMEAPAGAPASREKRSAFAGRSASVARAVKVSSLPAPPVFGPMKASTGATFTSLTVTVKVFASAKAGAPLSVTRTVMG